MDNFATSAKRYEALLTISDRLLEYRQIEDLIHQLASNLRSVIDFSCLELMLMSGCRDRPYWCAGEPLTLNAGCEDEQEWLWWAYEHQEVAVIPYRSFEGSREWLAQRGLASAYALPLTTTNRRIGAMLLASERENETPAEESRFLATVAQRIAIAVERLIVWDDSFTRRESAFLREEVAATGLFEEIVGSSESLRSVLAQLARVAPTDATVLITGESGTGKELIARAIHKRSRRSGRPFIPINCAAVPPSLIAAELFGYEKGAFTGANQRHIGRFESANGGTIFLDEIGDMPEETQIALLRVLQEREIQRVGGARSIPVDVRVLAATNRDLQREVETGKFRLDLFYRLNVFPIEVPPLRDRKEDILVLAKYFAHRFAAEAGKNIRWIEGRASHLLQEYDWPGNIRELQNVLQRAVILCDQETLWVNEEWLQSRPSKHKAPAALDSFLVKQEKEMIEATLTETRGRVSGPLGAAKRLGLPRTTLESKIRNLSINKHRFRVTAGGRLA